MLVIDKPAGLVVHPGAGNPRHTLQNALLGLRSASLAALPRAGIIHRLDKDTSGLLVVARTIEAHTALTRQLFARSVSREYLAVCVGIMTAGGSIDAPIGRHRSDRLRMAVRQDGRPAITHYRVLERFRAHSYLRVKLETGRTHQIRLHLRISSTRSWAIRLWRPLRSAARRSDGLEAPRRLQAAGAARGEPRVRSSALRANGSSLHSAVPPDFAELLRALREDARDAAALRAYHGRLMQVEWLTPQWPAPARGVRAVDAARGRGQRRPLCIAESGRSCRRRAGGGRGESAPAARRRRSAGRARLARTRFTAP